MMGKHRNHGRRGVGLAGLFQRRRVGSERRSAGSGGSLQEVRDGKGMNLG